MLEMLPLTPLDRLVARERGVELHWAAPLAARCRTRPPAPPTTTMIVASSSAALLVLCVSLSRRQCFGDVTVTLRVCYGRRRRRGTGNRPRGPSRSPGLGSRAAANLAAQARHVHVHGARLHEPVAPPHQRPAAPRGRTRGPGVPTSVARSSNSLGVSSTGRPFMRTSKRWRSISRSPTLSVGLPARPPAPARAGPPRGCARELARRERLGHVVVGAQLEAEDLVALLGAPGHHDDGHARASRGPA